MSVKTTGPVRSNYAVEVMDADSETPMQPSEKITWWNILIKYDEPYCLNIQLLFPFATLS